MEGGQETTVHATAIGQLAVHREREHGLFGWRVLDSWVVTHPETGSAVGLGFPNRETALAAARALVSVPLAWHRVALINGKAKVSPKLRARIRRIVREAGGQP